MYDLIIRETEVYYDKPLKSTALPQCMRFNDDDDDITRWREVYDQIRLNQAYLERQYYL